MSNSQDDPLPRETAKELVDMIAEVEREEAMQVEPSATTTKSADEQRQRKQ